MRFVTTGRQFSADDRIGNISCARTGRLAARYRCADGDGDCGGPDSGQGRAAVPEQFVNLQATIHVALRKRAGEAMGGEGTPARWQVEKGRELRAERNKSPRFLTAQGDAPSPGTSIPRYAAGPPRRGHRIKRAMSESGTLQTRRPAPRCPFSGVDPKSSADDENDVNDPKRKTSLGRSFSARLL
jgi:hypothetical protein